MMYDFSDLAKEKNFIGFRSGIVCFYPNYNDSTNDFLNSTANVCAEELFYNQTYKVKPEDPTPLYYDPRCRPWYKE